MTEKSVAGVCDYSHLPSKQKNWPTKIRFSSKEESINSGMMLLNLERIRNMNITQALEINEALGSKVVFADQDILNLVFEVKRKSLIRSLIFRSLMEMLVTTSGKNYHIKIFAACFDALSVGVSRG